MPTGCDCTCPPGAQGIRKTQKQPNPFLYQSVAQLAADKGLVEEARNWFVRGTRTLTVRRTPTATVKLGICAPVDNHTFPDLMRGPALSRRNAAACSTSGPCHG